MNYDSDDNTADCPIPRLKEIDDSNTGRFPTSAAPQWVPGLVEVEFRESAGFTDEELLDQLDKAELPRQWSRELSDFLTQSHIRTVQPSFAVLYPWSRETKEQALKSFKALGRDRFVTLRFPDGADVTAIAKALRSFPQIARANPVARLAPPSISEPLLGTSDQIVPFPDGLENQWYAVRCRLPEALERAKGKDVIIADIDWGFDEFHPDYAPFIEKQQNTFKLNGTIAEGIFLHHGTAVMGLAGARLNGCGIVGFAPESTLWAIQAGRDQIAIHNHWIAALDFVRTEPATKRKVIILEIQTASGGNVEGVETVRKAIIDAINANIVVCVPAGNTPGDAGKDDNNERIPCTDSVLVGATSFGATRNTVNSKSGPRIVVYAPGDPDHDVTCTTDTDGYRNNFGGTSGAVAKVAGAVALMLELDPLLTPAQVREILSLSNIPVYNASGANVGVLLDCADALNRVAPE